MKPITVVVPYARNVRSLVESALVEQIVILSPTKVRFDLKKCSLLVAGPLTSRETVAHIINEVSTEYLFLVVSGQQISIQSEGLQSLLAAAESTNAGLLYSDFYDDIGDAKTLHPLADYQLGSVRDDFDFGAAVLVSVSRARRALARYGAIPAVEFAALYDLRLKLSIDHSIYHVREPLYSAGRTASSSENATLFSYVDPRNERAQKELESVFTEYLKKIGAYLAPGRFREIERPGSSFPTEASVIIPVRNRKGTIAEAVKSALSQEADFTFNVIVVDNHSTDGTTAILSELAKQQSAMHHIVPVRTDLAIGGCWNEAIHSDLCGRYAVQLDSDDLYSTSRALRRIVDILRQGNYAMVVGSYTLVNQQLEEIPPGLIDHREWTDENGRNNALRINGLGAPRAFNTALLRTIGFPNVSYGEDYAAALRICREYRIGRIYESLYLCRRWPGNTDAALSIDEKNRNNVFKDEVRSAEIVARKKMNLEGWGHGSRGTGHGSDQT